MQESNPLGIGICNDYSGHSLITLAEDFQMARRLRLALPGPRPCCTTGVALAQSAANIGGRLTTADGGQANSRASVSSAPPELRLMFDATST